MPKSAFFAEIVGGFSQKGAFFFLCFFFLLKPAGRTVMDSRKVEEDVNMDVKLSR